MAGEVGPGRRGRTDLARRHHSRRVRRAPEPRRVARAPGPRRRGEAGSARRCYRWRKRRAQLPHRVAFASSVPSRRSACCEALWPRLEGPHRLDVLVIGKTWEPAAGGAARRAGLTPAHLRVVHVIAPGGRSGLESRRPGGGPRSRCRSGPEVARGVRAAGAGSFLEVAAPGGGGPPAAVTHDLDLGVAAGVGLGGEPSAEAAPQSPARRVARTATVSAAGPGEMPSSRSPPPPRPGSSPTDAPGDSCSSTRLRLVEDPHLWASTLHDELVELGFAGSYPSLNAAIRAHGLRPHCEPCQASKGRESSIITRPPGEETQWDWLELPNPPTSWGLGREAHLLVGRWRIRGAGGRCSPTLRTSRT